MTLDLQIDQARIEEVIVERAVKEILGDSTMLDSRIYNEVERLVNDAVSKTINDRVEAALSSAMSAALDDEIQPLTLWGESAGQPTTLRAALHARAKDFWNEKVDKEGKQSTYGGKPRWEHVVSVMTAREFDNAIKQNIVNIAGAIKDAVRATFYEQVDKKLDEFFKIRSLDDANRPKITRR